VWVDVGEPCKHEVVPGWHPGKDRRSQMNIALGELEAGTLVRLWTTLSAWIVGYGFGIEYATLERPKLGIFNGLKLSIDPAVDFEMQCFLLLHLFGHSVQWVAPSYRPETLGLKQDDREVYLAALERYERNAARFGLSLLHEAGITDLDQWFIDFAETDWRYVETFYRQGSLPRWETCRVRGAEPVEPLPIPPFHPRPVEERFAF
jgi:hypothetical protein